MKKYRRALRKLFNRSEKRTETNLKNTSTTVLIVSAILFIAVQLGTNAILSPLGHQLRSYNDERNALIEENRELDKSIAIDSSLVVLNNFSDKKLEISRADSDNTIHVSARGLTALK